MQSRSVRKSDGVKEFGRTVVFALLIALGIRTFLFEPFNIPSSSMVPTLLVGDYLFVSKFSYGYSQYSLPFSPSIAPGRILFTEPERGDVAVFKKPTDNETDYIKRIIGLPGDKIRVVNGVLHINGKAVERKRVEDFIDVGPFGRQQLTPQFIETLPNGVEHRILERNDVSPGDDTPVYTVPAGHYFMMGDNRDNSIDSRFPDVGMVPKDNLVGRAEIIFYSTAVRASFIEFWAWMGGTRFSRLFQSID